MKPYLLSLGVGLLVGVIYSLLNVRSPAPPAIALVGLLGILLGEQAVPYAKVMIQHHRAMAEFHAPRPEAKTPERLTTSYNDQYNDQ
ncbi:DUF1427 family protein [Paraburkholderia flava]|uniref:DUF1427 family protein n=1 Tax=Paraburkholderia flava TaxID=2547393 RepID=UPI0010612D5E|nr:DUF1427 family protein [Paraburkholderia flava]